MKSTMLDALRFATLLLLFPGAAGMVVSAMISTHYRDTLPKISVPEEMRMTPRNIGGVVVYQTEEESQRLNLIEYSSTAAFALGIGLGILYFEKKGNILAGRSEDEQYTRANII